MKKWRLWIWSVVACSLFFLASLSVAWAMPGQSTLNQSIPTRTLLPPPPARGAGPTDTQNPNVGIPGAIPTATPAPADIDSPQSSALPLQLPVTPQTADTLFPPLSPAESAPGASPAIAAPGTASESSPAGSPAAIEGFSSQSNSQRDSSWLTLLFPDAQSPQTSVFTSLLGGVLLTLGIVILFLVGQRRTK